MLSWWVPLVALACQARVCISSPGFLASTLTNSSESIARLAYLDQLEELLGKGRRKSTESRLYVIKEILRATFVAMPKTAHGRLSAASARYAMHRLFVQRHGWHVKGVAPTGGSWSPASAALGFSEHLSPRIQDLLGEQFSGNDFDLDELALLGATIEALIHSEAVGRLYATYRLLEMDPEVPVSEEKAVDAVYMCLTAYLTGNNISRLSREALRSTCKLVEEQFPQWVNTKTLIQETQRQVAPTLQVLEFSDVELILELVSEKMGHRVDEGACQDIEDRLVALQDSIGSGRVRLSDFYSSHLEGEHFEFNERPEYLRQLGVLDESDPSAPRIMIPNYLTMAGNCFNVSSYYDLCCIDLCEDLMDALERHIKAPQASPSEIVTILNSTESAYVPVGRTLSESLMKKLSEVAEAHSGQVPLHGRLFAQWMHFAYPNECPYPHLSGTTKPVSEAQWLAETGTPPIATQDQMHSIINMPPSTHGVTGCDNSEEEGMCMWAPEEELVDAVSWRTAQDVVPEPVPAQPAQVGARTVLRVCAFGAMLASSAMVMRNVVRQMREAIEEANGGEASFVAFFLRNDKDPAHNL